ncbi:MAG: hypothetical protein HBSAPP03_18460 [Phycisphaerae bacterium]|nr:MAG: hypothetical protein HBSAPP03_18460 [Phycisphaerae bacterium]
MPRKLDIGPSFEEFASTLTWPRLLRAAGLAIRPSRVGLSLVLLLLIGLIAQAPSLWLGTGVGPMHTVVENAEAGMRSIKRAVLDADLPALIDGLRMMFLDGPLAAAEAYPWSSLIILIPILTVWGVLGGAISRLAAEEHALGLRRAWTAGLAFALSRWFSLAMCTLGPILVVLVVCLAMACVGWLMLGVPYLQVVGGALFVLALLVGACVTVLGGGLLVGSPMLVPGVACEGTDAIDSVQRVLAYMMARPGRVALYLFVLLLQLIVALWALWMVVHVVETLTTRSVTAMLPKETATLVAEAVAGSPPADGLSPSQAWMARALAFWGALPDLFVGAFAVSYWFSGGTVLYLGVRRICDGQDIEELWTPGLTPGTVPTEDDPADDDEE